MVVSTFDWLLSRFIGESTLSERALADLAELDHTTVKDWREGKSHPRNRQQVVSLVYALALTRQQASALMDAARSGWALTSEEEKELAAIRQASDPFARESLIKLTISHTLKLTESLATLDQRINAVQSESARGRIAAERTEHAVARARSAPVGLIELRDFLDSDNERYWPKQSDIAAGHLYRPTDRYAGLDDAVKVATRALVEGPSGAGKTALAIGYGLHWQAQHSGAAVYYLDVRASALERDGGEWHRQLCELDDKDALVIVDNCHLARRATNALVSRVTRQPPTSAFLFVSAPRVGDSPWDESPEDYFDAFEKANTLRVKAGDHLDGILAGYSKLFCESQPAKYVPVQEDLADPERAARIQRLVEHSLIAARALVDAWFKLGGRVSDVPRDAVLDLLKRRYLHPRMRPVLGPLCALGQFDIGCHASFLEQFPADSVAAVRAEHLLVPEDGEYGQCYRLNLHPQTAALVWRAFLGQRAGIPIERRFQSETFTQLKQYLLSGVENFVEVYRQTFRHGAADLQRDLLADADVQERIRKQLADRPTAEALYYLFGMRQWDAPLAANLLRELVGVATEQIRAELVESGRHVSLAAAQLLDIDADCAKLILGGLEALDVARLASERHPTVALGWISKRPNSVAARLGYGSDWRSTVARHLDMTKVAIGTDSYSSQSWFWFIRDLAASAPEQLQTLIEILGPRGTARLLERLGVGNATRVLHWARATALGDEWFSDVADELDALALTAKIGRRQYLKELYSFLSELPSVTDRFADAYLRRLTPARVAELLRAPNVGVGALDRLHGVASSRLMADVLTHLSIDDVTAIFARSGLGEVGTFIEHRYRQYRVHYRMFELKHLPQRLAADSLAEIGKFVTRLARVSAVGTELAAQAIAALEKTELGSRVACADVETLALLEEAIGRVERERVAPLLQAIPPGALRSGVAVSQMRGIQLLLHNTAKWAPTHVAKVADAIRSVDLVECIRKAPPGEIARFLWNSFKLVDPPYARTMCRTVDGETSAAWFVDSDLVSLAHFLWNLCHLTEGGPLASLRHPGLALRIASDIDEQPGPCLRLLGIMSVDGVDIRSLTNPFSTWSAEGKSLARSWLGAQLDDNHPYEFMLGARALAVLDEAAITELVAPVVRSQGARLTRLLADTKANAETSRSKDLVRNTHRLIANLGLG